MKLDLNKAFDNVPSAHTSSFNTMTKWTLNESYRISTDQTSPYSKLKISSLQKNPMSIGSYKQQLSTH